MYPNDTGTLRVAKQLEAKYPARVRVIVNTLPGPTSKGQMLNEMFAQVFGSDECPEMVVLHDSEDVIDPRIFAVYAAHAGEYDFIQAPVFSLKRAKGAHVASTYMDEFAERHTREMIARNAVGAAIPSAGVGTCISKKLIRHFLRTRGQVLMSGAVTEDYILGVEAKREGFKGAFAAVSKRVDEGLDFVATREFFPKTLTASIKQKTRWVYGINFEAMHKVGWNGDLWDLYFFLRDRKGMLTNFLPPISLFLLVIMMLGYIDVADLPAELQPFLLASNVDQPHRARRPLFDPHRRLSQSFTGRPTGGAWRMRWPVSLYINMAASWRASKTYLRQIGLATKPIVWSKTTHELPEDFMAATR